MVSWRCKRANHAIPVWFGRLEAQENHGKKFQVKSQDPEPSKRRVSSQMSLKAGKDQSGSNASCGSMQGGTQLNQSRARKVSGVLGTPFLDQRDEQVSPDQKPEFRASQRERPTSQSGGRQCDVTGKQLGMQTSPYNPIWT